MFVVEGFIIGFVILGFFVFMQNLIPSTFQNFKKVFINMLCIAIRQIDVDICESYKLLLLYPAVALILTNQRRASFFLSLCYSKRYMPNY